MFLEINKKIKKNRNVLLIIFLSMILLGLIFGFYKKIAVRKYSSKEECVKSVSSLKLEDLGLEIARLVNKYGMERNSDLSQEFVLNKNYYYICEIFKNRDDKNKKDVVENLIRNFTDPRAKEHFLEKFYGVYNGEQDYVPALAFGDFDELCPEKLKNFCYSNPKSSLKSDCMGRTACDKICNILRIMQNDEVRNKTINRLINMERIYPDCSENPPILRVAKKKGDISKINFGGDVALIYRYEGASAVHKICDNFVDPKENAECKEKIDGYLNLLKAFEVFYNKKDCSILRNSTIDILCSDIIKYD